VTGPEQIEAHDPLNKTSAPQVQAPVDQLAAQRFVNEAQRLAHLGSDDWRFQIGKSAQRLGVSPISLEAAVHEILQKKGGEKKAGGRSQRRVDQLAAKLIRYGEVADRLPVLQQVENALAAATTVEQVKDIHDAAIGMATYAHRANNRDLEADAAEIRMKAARKLGEMIEKQKATVGLAKGAREPGTKRGTTRVIEKPASLAEAGIDKNLAHQARSLAKMPEPVFEQAVQDKRQAVVHRSTRPVSAKPAAPPKRVTHLDVLGLWMDLPAAERPRFFDSVGLSAILDNIPEAWADALARWVEDRRRPKPPVPNPNPAIPDDLSIPDCLRQPILTETGGGRD
jgi:hypothetical protein